MILHFHFLLVVQLLSACVMAPLGAMNYETDRKWNAYRLSGGPQAETGYRWLLVSQKSLEEIANLVETSIPISDEDSPAIWVLTHGAGKDWTLVKSLEVPPAITGFRTETQTVAVGGVEYKVESIPFQDAIPLLLKEQEKMQRSSVGPLYVRNRTALALKEFIQSETQESEADKGPTKLSVASSFGGERSVISSTVAESGPHTGSLHGLQVILGPEKRLRELAVYDNGFLERRETYIEDGFELVHEEFRREPIPGGQGGNGYRRVNGRGTAGSPPSSLAEGFLLDGKPWHGNFVFVESIPERTAFVKPLRLVLQEFSEGKIVATKTDVSLGFGDLEKEQSWLKKLPSNLKGN